MVTLAKIKILRERQWQKNCKRIAAFAAAGVDINRPLEDKKLNGWLLRQTTYLNRKKLSPAHYDQLTAIGVILNKQEALWDAWYDKLKRHAAKHRRDVNYPISDPGLKTWVKGQKERKSKGTLAADKVTALEALGIIWPVSKEELHENRRRRALASLARFNATSP